MRKTFVIVSIVALALAGCGNKSSNNAASPSPKASKPGVGGVAVLTVNTGQASGIGTVLVDARGLTLYHLTGETTSNFKCTSSCTSTWPPLLLTTPGGPTGGTQVTGTLDTVTRPDGGEQVTYNGLTLYTYAGDSNPGDANGQGIGGVWYAVGPSGSTGGAGASPSASGGYGY
jgi:predicted lipoprotein with Yx(FWY)xxD motif